MKKIIAIFVCGQGVVCASIFEDSDYGVFLMKLILRLIHDVSWKPLVIKLT